MGSQGVYTHTVSYDKDADCPICSAGVTLTVDPNSTLQQVGGGVADCPICSAGVTLTVDPNSTLQQVGGGVVVIVVVVVVGGA